jgi:hypothetical protein
MTHKLTGREVYDALREQQGHPGEFIAGFSTWIDGKVYFDALAQRLNKICHPDAGGSNDAMTEQGVLLMQDPPAAVPPPAVQTAMRNRLRAYRANDPAEERQH